MSSNVFMNNQLERIADYIDAGKAGGGSLTVNLSGVGDMTGASAGQAGAHGLVPAPAAGDENKVLSGAGTWIDAGNGGELGDLEDVTITSPTSGESLKYDGAKWVNGNVTAKLPDFIEETSGNIVTVEAAERPAKNLKVAINPVQSGSGDPSPDNIRPISGWTECNVCNLSNIENVQYFKGLLDGKYGFVDLGTLNWNYTTTGGINVFNRLKLSNAKVNGRLFCSKYPTGSYGKTSSAIIATDKEIWYNASGTGYVTANNIMIKDSAYTDAATFKTAMNGVYLIYELAAQTAPTITPTEFNTLISAFGLQGWLVQITFPSEAGTVYGGTLDVTNGTLTVTKANITSYDGETLPGAWISDRDVYAEETTPTTGAQVVYDLDTPITYQLTPTEVQMLLGTNNIWADTGEVKELKYIPQTYNDLLEEVTGGGYDITTNGTPVETGITWDGYPVKCFCVRYYNLSLNTNTQDISLAEYGFSDTINGLFKVDCIVQNGDNMLNVTPHVHYDGHGNLRGRYDTSENFSYGTGYIFIYYY